MGEQRLSGGTSVRLAGQQLGLVVAGEDDVGAGGEVEQRGPELFLGPELQPQIRIERDRDAARAGDLGGGKDRLGNSPRAPG